MEEENKKDVQVSEQEMEQINQEITSVEQSKIEEAKKAGLQEGMQKAQEQYSIKELQDKLSQYNQKMAEMEKKFDEMSKPKPEEKKIEETTVEPEKVEEEKPQRKGVVPESNSPYQPKEPVQTQPIVQESPSEQWANFEAAAKQGRFSASIKKEDI